MDHALHALLRFLVAILVAEVLYVLLMVALAYRWL